MDLTGKTRAEWTSMCPWLVRNNNLWITAIAIVLLKAEDITEADTLKARGYLPSHLSEKEVAKLLRLVSLEMLINSFFSQLWIQS